MKPNRGTTANETRSTTNERVQQRLTVTGAGADVGRGELGVEAGSALEFKPTGEVVGPSADSVAGSFVGSCYEFEIK